MYVCVYKGLTREDSLRLWNNTIKLVAQRKFSSDKSVFEKCPLSIPLNCHLHPCRNYSFRTSFSFVPNGQRLSTVPLNSSKTSIYIFQFFLGRETVIKREERLSLFFLSLECIYVCVYTRLISDGVAIIFHPRCETILF